MKTKCEWHDQFDDECVRCHRQKRFEKVKNDNPQPFYIVVYEIERHYGGPQEGGWYYDTQIVIDCKKLWSISQTLKQMRELREEYPQPKYKRTSVLGSYDIFIDLIPTLECIRERTERPQYE